MRRHSRIVLVAVSGVALLALASCAPELYSSGGTSTYFGFTLGVESAPPPPRLLFRDTPRYEDVEDSDVRVVDSPDPDCDLFAFQGWYYLYAGGYWYRSDRYDGPYAVVEVRRVPRAVLTVPDERWHHRPQWDHVDRGRHRGRAERDDDDRH